MTARKKGNATGNTDMTANIGGKLLNRNEEIAQEKPKERTKLVQVESKTKVPVYKEVDIDEPETDPETLQDEQESAQAIDILLESEAAPQSQKIEPEDKKLDLEALGLTSKKANRSHRISIFVTEDIYQRLQDLKKQSGVSVNSMVNAAITLLLEDNNG